MLTEFHNLVAITGWNSENLFRIFLNSLNDYIRDELLRENRPGEFPDCVTWALAIDRQLTERATDRASCQPQQQQPNSSPVFPPASPHASFYPPRTPQGLITDHSTPMVLSNV